MSNIMTIAKYQFTAKLNALLIFYGILTGIVALGMLTTGRAGVASFSGFEITGGVFLFILGLNSFRSMFRFAQATNISRKTFYWGTLLGLLILATFMAISAQMFAVVVDTFITYESLYEQLYPESLVAEFIWSFSLFVLAAYGGWFVTMLYYRSNPAMKTVISMSPVFALILLTYAHRRSGYTLLAALINFTAKVLGLIDINAYYAVASFSVLAVIAAFFTFLLIRRAPIND